MLYWFLFLFCSFRFKVRWWKFGVIVFWILDYNVVFLMIIYGCVKFMMYELCNSLLEIDWDVLRKNIEELFNVDLR